MVGGQKLVRPFRGMPLVRWMAEALVRARLEPIVAVVGPDSLDVSQALSGITVRLVANPRSSEGMGTSVAAGVRALGPDVEAAVIALADMPLTSSQLIAALVDAFKSSGRSIVVPVHSGQRGHPVVFDLRRHRDALEHLCEDEGARSLLRRCPEEVLEVDTSEQAVLLDVDTEEDLSTLERQP